jgi:hypothetical protein
MKREKLEELASEKNIACVTISMNTHRNFPENEKDLVVLRELLKEAKERVIKGYGKRMVSDLVLKIDEVEKEIDVNYNLDSILLLLTRSIFPKTLQSNH